MKEEELIKFNTFRRLCLTNAEDAIRTAEELENKGVNHIAFQLLVFSLEEIGKVFVGWYQFNAKETWGKEAYNIPMDDHIKKLFWAIWGPSFTNEKFTSQQMEEIKEMASNLHTRRLSVMYTELSDTVPSSAKISNEELGTYLKMTRSRLELAKLEGEVDTNLNDSSQEDIKWFMETSNHPERRKFIFGHQSQEKLIELGEVKDWLNWLKEHFTNEEKELKQILKRELEKSVDTVENKFEPKWKITIKVVSKSHSIRQNVLNKFNSKSDQIKFKKGAGSHTLLIDIILGKSIPIQELWHQGWNTSNLIVAALNVGTNGLFYWNLPRNVDKFYEGIRDLESKRKLEAKLHTSLEIDWSSKRLYFKEDEIALTFLVFRYFSETFSSQEFVPVNHFLQALGMLAKTDMHLRLEPQCYLNFYLAFKEAIVLNEKTNKQTDIKELGFKLIGNLLKTRDEYDRVMDIGSELEKNNGKIGTTFTLTEIIGMKQYAGLYFVTLAARKMYGNDSILITTGIDQKDEPTNKQL
ncbi:AbiV family abortive infection protein [Ulvibacterium sp.]|uniref:AbiV family abortive infection protein n=1 Tax=Ulvibacterium sp. TaxID=2665914 RepID=UPI002619014B|nr:AbiV family abortive infection protein [Ulvibacterium sp.]